MKRPENLVVGQKFRVEHPMNGHFLSRFPKGTVVTFLEEGTDDVGWFINEKGDKDALDFDRLEPLEKTLDDLEKGDVVVGKLGTQKVLGILGDLYFLSHFGNFERAQAVPYTLSELKEEGYTLKSPTPPKVKVTMEEVAKALGREVGTFEVEG